MEKAYDFRQKLLTVHEENLRDSEKKPLENEFFFPDNTVISIKSDVCEVIKTAAEDFVDFLKVSMNISAVISVDDKKADLKICLAHDENIDLEDVASYRGFMIKTDEKGVVVYGHDARGAAQGLYFLEDIMSFNKAPSVPFGAVKKKPMFSPQMVHSGYGLDSYPDEYLARIAHEGRDAILVFTKSVNETPDGYLDFNDLIKRAKRYGLDVYAYSYIRSEKGPDEDGAEEYYEGTYGRLFRECPGLKGVTLVGESCEFPSKDPHVSGKSWRDNNVDGIPTGKLSPGWFPCMDYPIWLNMLKKVIRKYRPDADIVFWTYNWGGQPLEYRVKLIEALPTDISLQATFEAAEPVKYENAKGHCADYTLSFEGYGKYFESEAKAAKKRGIKLYSMTNTGGLTWDFGVIPYQPMPHQWIKRYKAMRKAHKDWGLCGVMETHHYGFYPSFISKLSKWCFFEPEEDMSIILEKVLKGTFGEDNYEKVNEGLEYLSEAIRYYTPNDSDQYGAFRVGPSYPFNLEQMINLPSSPDAMFGNGIMFPYYQQATHPLDSLTGVLAPEEIKSHKIMLDKMEKSVKVLESIENASKKTEELINLVRFIYRSAITGANAKKWYLLRCRMYAASDRETLAKIFDEMEELLLYERQNAESAIPLVENDSRLGWEPSMLYMTDKWHIEWKIRHIDYVIGSELANYKRCLSN